jgi:hypothetical protein
MGGSAASRTGDDTGAAGGAEALALETLHRDWGSAWAIGCGAGRWQAARRDRSGCVLTRASAAGLAMALRVSYGRPQ